MRFRLLGLALLGISAIGFVVVTRHAGAERPAESAWWELLLSLFCVPAAAVGLPFVAFGSALYPSCRTADRGRSRR